MSNFMIWKDCNQQHLYELYRILLKNVDVHSSILKRLENFKEKDGDYHYKFNHIIPSSKGSYYESEEFIQDFLATLYKNSSKKISKFDRLI